MRSWPSTSLPLRMVRSSNTAYPLNPVERASFRYPRALLRVCSAINSRWTRRP